MLIEVMGIEGEKTTALDAAVRDALDGLALCEAPEVRRVTDPTAIVARGARRWPALRVDGRVLCAGATPAAAEIRAWLQQADAAEAAGA